MIPRIRPFFHKDYIKAANGFEPSINRDKYTTEISQKFQQYYPNASAFEYFNFGRNSLRIGLTVLDLKASDEILIPCFTCSTILKPILDNQMTPVLYDIRFDFGVDIDQLKKRVTPKTKAILVTHYFGIPSNIKEIKEFADSMGIYLIEDCAHSICSKFDGAVLGGVGDFAFTSFGNDKPLSLGGGSMFILNNKDYSNKLYGIASQINLNDIHLEKCTFLSLLFFHLKTEKSLYHQFIGTHHFYHYFTSRSSEVKHLYNELKKMDPDLSTVSRELSLFQFQHSNRLLSIYHKVRNRIITDPLLNAMIAPKRMNVFSLNILDAAMGHIEEINAARKRIGQLYSEKLEENNAVAIPAKRNDIPYLRYSIIYEDPKKTANIVKKLNSSGYECGNFNWGMPLSKILNVAGKFENSEYIAKNIVNLPCHFGMNENEVSEICETINGDML
jgi:dTDP-4-amino-4,6-dideoxygalactose transaminase